MGWTNLLSNIIIPVIGSLSTLFAAGVAIWGILTWRREYVGKRRIDLAEEILALTYELEDFYKAVRCPLGRQGEGSTRQSLHNETEEEKAMLDQAYVQIERCNNRPELFSKIRSLRYRFMVQHGRKAGKLIEELHDIKYELSKPFRRLLLRFKNVHRTDPKRLKKQLDDIWDEEWKSIYGYDDKYTDGNDPLLEKVHETVQKIEKICHETIGLPHG